MQYQFCGTLHKEGNRTFLPIPFNIGVNTIGNTSLEE